MKSPIQIESPLFRDRPTQIHILSRTYRITWKDGEFTASDGDTVQGECSNKEQELIVNWETHPASAIEVLLHEVGHAIYYMLEGDDIKREEEDFVNVMTIVQVTIMRQNPKLWRWIVDMLEVA